MKFICAYRTSRGPLTRDEFAPLARDLGDRPNSKWVFAGPFAARGDDVASDGARIVVGNAHMGHGQRLDGLLVLLAAGGIGSVDHWTGDFGLVIFERANAGIVAARDPFGVQPLFTAKLGDLVLFSSHLRALERHGTGRYDPEYAVDFLVEGSTRTRSTILRDVETAAPGSLLVQRGPHRQIRRFWSPEAFPSRTPPTRTPRGAQRAEEDVHRFRELFREAVCFNLSDSETPRSEMSEMRNAWAHLSGGLDSSAIVCVATELEREGLVSAGLANTVTFCDGLCDGDEREFSDAVVAHTGVTNLQLASSYSWQHDAPPMDVPSVVGHLRGARERMAAAMTSAGARVLLSGAGSDQYLDGWFYFLSDELARGLIREPLRDAFAFAVEEKRSLWELLGRRAVLPLFPAKVQARFMRIEDVLPDWIRPEFVRETFLLDRLRDAYLALSPAGKKFDSHIAHQLGGISGSIEMDRYDDIEQRYPFLYRPLVEHALTTPAMLRVRPDSRKWILREAMRGTLPELVRTRKRKGCPAARTLWSMARERTRLDALLRDPILAHLGWVDAAGLRLALDALLAGRNKLMLPVVHALALEEWLRAREERSDLFRSYSNTQYAIQEGGIA